MLCMCELNFCGTDQTRYFVKNLKYQLSDCQLLKNDCAPCGQLCDNLVLTYVQHIPHSFCSVTSFAACVSSPTLRREE